MRLGWSVLVLGIALPAIGCDSPPRRPWEQPAGEATPAVLAPPPPKPSTSSAGDPPAPGPSETSVLADEPVFPPVRVGGPWVRCYGSFRVSGEPLRDVTRLGLLCGPENGMRRLSAQAMVGSVAEGQPPVVETFSSKRGECYRIFAVAEAQVGDLDVAVKSSRDAVIAADHGEDAWPIVQPDRPFCVLEDDTLRIEISARRGQGRFAAELWGLPRPARAD
ncbi:MAG: hypothetical protein HUU21_28445 [Polyangiaceae bacterium]|nr:hypothetical protein [Polyangiaceae bacterium]NUQ77486.1 hypothetical protein [Polyangiaceae bacterium]